MSKKLHDDHIHGFEEQDLPDKIFGLFSKFFLKGKRLKTLEWILRVFPSPFNHAELASHFLHVINGDIRNTILKCLQRVESVTILTMDFEFMGAGVPDRKFEEQLKEAIKMKKDFGAGKVKVFMCLDPRRPNLLQLVSDYYHDIDGYKLYSPLGYEANDIIIRMILQMFPKPVSSHCTNTSPIFGKQYKDPDYYKNLAHPKYLYKLAEEFPNINFSAEHWGGEDPEWKKFISDRLRKNFFTNVAFTYKKPPIEDLIKYDNVNFGSDYCMGEMEEPLYEIYDDYYKMPDALIDKMNASRTRFHKNNTRIV